MSTTPQQYADLPVDAPPAGRRGPLFDSGVVLLVGVLMTLGVTMVYSASVTLAGAELDWQRWWATPLRQCVFALAGFLGMLVVAHCNPRWLAWERPDDGWRPMTLFGLAVLGLVALQIVGQEALGARRALVVLSEPVALSFQPAEVAKVVLVIWLAALLGRPAVPRRGLAPAEQNPLRSFRRGFLPAFLSAGLLIALTGVEDFGTAALMGVLTIVMLAIAGARLLHLGGAGLLGLAGGVLLICVREFRSKRLLAWWSQEPDRLGDGYQIYQSLLAIGSGGWFGRGLGAGVQKYGYLPQDNNDFILATICEELGIAGGIVVIVLFMLLMWRGWRLFERAGDSFGRLLAAGLTLLIGLQAALNVAVVTNSVPTKGISLPFVSAGGSGVLFLGLAAGLLASLGGPWSPAASSPGHTSGVSGGGRAGEHGPIRGRPERRQL